MKNLGLYIHIPFCKQRCLYCDFVSFPKIEEKQGEYIEVVIQELKEKANPEYQITTIYIGGGTPSYLPLGGIKRIMQKVMELYNVWKEAEITIEVNPGTVTKEKLEEYREVGINRISIGLQETDNLLLQTIGRIHTYEEFLENYMLAKEVGFQNINVDLMIGLPGQTLENVKKSVSNIIALNPEHVSVYSLILEEGTPLNSKIEKGELTLPEEELERMEYWYVKNKLELAGYKHYEISNFAKPKKESKHNTSCWKQEEYLGIGLAAHSYIDGVRFSNIENLEEYLQNAKQKQWEKNKIIQEMQTIEDKQKEYMLLGLRMLKGVSIQEFKAKYGNNPIYLYRNALQKLVEEKLITINLDTIKLTNKGLDLANIVWEEFI